MSVGFRRSLIRRPEPFQAELMKMWSIDRKVGSPRNCTPDILDEIEPLPAED